MTKIINPALVPIETVAPGTVGVAYSMDESPMIRNGTGGAWVAMAATVDGGVWINDPNVGGSMPCWNFKIGDGFTWTHFLPLPAMMIEVAPAPVTAWIVEGEHFHVPGRVLNIYATKAGADLFAASLVNKLIEWTNGLADDDEDRRRVEGEATAENWQEKLKEAQRAYWAAETPEDELDQDFDFESESEGYVTVTAMEVEP